MKNNFSQYAKYYDLLYAEKKYNEEAQYISQLIRNSGVRGNLLLELGSGTGKHARSLVKEGFSVTGIELSQEMVDRGNTQNIEGFKCYQGDICNVNLEKKFDAVISLFHVISYITTNKSLNSLFHKVSGHLEIGGLFAFDFWYGPAVLSQGVETRVKRIREGSIDIMRIAESEIRDQDSCVDVTYTINMVDIETAKIDTFREVHTMRYFSLLELDSFAHQHGLMRVVQEEFLTKNIISMKTWGVCVAYRKVA